MGVCSSKSKVAGEALDGKGPETNGADDGASDNRTPPPDEGVHDYQNPEQGVPPIRLTSVDDLTAARKASLTRLQAKWGAALDQ